MWNQKIFGRKTQPIQPIENQIDVKPIISSLFTVYLSFIVALGWYFICSFHTQNSAMTYFL